MCTDTTTAAHALTWVLRCHLCTQSEISQVSALQDEHNASNHIFQMVGKVFHYPIVKIIQRVDIAKLFYVIA